MKQRKLLILLLAFFCAGTVWGQFFKTVDVGKMQCFVYDHGCMSQAVKACGNVYYYRGSYVTWDDIRMADDNQEWPGGLLKCSGMFFGARNWTDTTGHTWDAILTGHSPRYRESEDYQFGVPDEDGYPIRRYMRYAPPRITVDGFRIDAPFNLSGDEVAPEKILGTADIMVESNVRLSVGVDAKQRVLAWSQKDHDDYIIWDWTFVNTGNVDRDKDIELSGQTLNDVYICRVTEAFPDGHDNHKAMPTWAGTTENHDTRLSYPQDDDSLRIDFLTPLRSHITRYDNYGKRPDANSRLLNGARFAGTAVLFAPKSIDVPQNYPILDVAESNDPAQPCMHSSLLTEPSWIMLNEGSLGDFPGADSGDHRYGYELMVKGGFALPSSDNFFQDVYYMDSVYDVYDSTASGAKTHYEQPLDRWDELASKDLRYMFANDIGYLRFDVQCHWSIGPYQMGFMDTLRYVYAYVGGAISRKTSYLLGEAWDGGNGDATSYGWLAGLDSTTMVQELSKRDPIFNQFYDPQYKKFLRRGIPNGLNDIAKDLMVATGKDSLFNNGMNAQRNFNKNYNIPASPAPPSFFQVQSKSDMIELTWDYDDGPPSDLARFKIYRAQGGHVFEKQGSIILGDWQLHDSVGPDVRLYGDDTSSVTPGFDYFYALTAVSNDGIESGKFLTMTTLPARLVSAPADNLDSVRIVPNPCHINRDVVGRYGEGDGNKILFFNLPGECIITILTESGNLVTTIDHDKDAGIAIWEDIAGRYLFTDSDQFPVSGIYIAHIQEKATGKSVSLKFVIVR
jgi:hypothetical protein